MILSQYLRRRFTAMPLLFVLALSGGRSVAQSTDPWQDVSSSADRVIATLDELRAMQPPDGAVTDAMVNRLMDSLAPIVDFDTIAATVMGAHADRASKAQIEEFSRVFRNTMATLYLQSFLTFGVAEVAVDNAPPDFNPADTRASVRMQARDLEGNNYQIRYSMRKDADSRWWVRNIIVEGINLGLTYLNQFDSAMQRYGDIDRVIENWREEIENIEIEADP